MSIYAVNGKEPIAAWIPSLDTAGNGTTALTDLVGANNGTLTNMDAATDWVADTGAGGVRALDFDGVNDRVAISRIASYQSSVFTASIWLNMGATTETSNRSIFGSFSFSTTFAGWLIQKRRSNAGDGTQGKLVFAIANSSGSYVPNYSINLFPTSQWAHVLFSYDGSVASGYINGVLQFSNTVTYAPNVSSPVSFGGPQSGLLDEFYRGLLDDARIFNQALTADDVAFLYNSGNGRGRLSGTIQTRRRRDLGGAGL